MNIFLSIWHCSLSFLGCSLNILLIYVAIFKSPKAIRTYATLIINFAVTDFVECALDWFLQLRLLPAPGGITLTYIMYGTCKYISPFACKFGASLFLHCLPHSIWSLLLSFGYRYYILHNAALSRIKLLKIILLIYIPSLFQGLTYWTTFVPREEILPLAKKWFPNYDLESEPGVITGILDVTNWAAAYGIFHICIPIFPVYTAIFVLRHKIVKHLNENTQMMAPETKAAHAQLLRALTMQTVIPAFMGIAVTCYFIAQSGVIISPVFEHGVFLTVLLLPTLSPLTYLCFVRPYRHFVSRLLLVRISPRAASFGGTGKLESSGHAFNAGTIIAVSH